MISEIPSYVLTNLAYQSPAILICLGCLIYLGANSRRAGAGAGLAIAGFCLILFLAVAAPFANSRMLGFSPSVDVVVTIVFVLLRGASYILLLAGIMAGRSASPAGYPQQNYPQQNYPPQNYPPQNYPPQNYPPQNYPPQNYPPQNYPPQQNYTPPPPGQYPQ